MAFTLDEQIAAEIRRQLKAELSDLEQKRTASVTRIVGISGLLAAAVLGITAWAGSTLVGQAQRSVVDATSNLDTRVQKQVTLELDKDARVEQIKHLLTDTTDAVIQARTASATQLAESNRIMHANQTLQDELDAQEKIFQKKKADLQSVASLVEAASAVSATKDAIVKAAVNDEAFQQAVASAFSGVAAKFISGPADNLRIEYGRTPKTNAGALRIAFKSGFQEPPTVLLSSNWENVAGGVGQVDSVQSVDRLGVFVNSSNASPSYYVSYIAIGK